MDAYENLGPVPGQPHPVPPPVEQVLPLRHNDSVRLDSDENTDKQEYQKKVNKEEQPKNYKIQKRSIKLNQGPKNSRTPKSPTEPLIRTEKSSAHKRERCYLLIALNVVAVIFVFAITTTVIGVLHIFEILSLIKVFNPKNCPVL
ncbi:hypothetical protein COOONC_15874 [Cooperia oncophora]